MELTEFKNICRDEEIEPGTISDLCNELSSLAFRELNEDILRISIRMFLSESKPAPEHDCPRRAGGGYNRFAFCGKCRNHVCGLQGFGMELYDYCASCEGRGSVSHFASVINMAVFSRDMGLKKGYNGEARLKRYKEIYGLN